MAPKKPLPPPPGPRPRRLTRASAKLVAPDPKPLSGCPATNKSPNSVVFTKTTPPEVAVLQSSCPSPLSLKTETVPVVAESVALGSGGGEKQERGLIETKPVRNNFAEKETLAQEINEISDIIEEKESIEVKTPKKKMVKKVVVKVVKKIVKKRVPKSMIKDLVVASCSSDKDLTNKEEVYDDDDEDKICSEGIEEDKGLENPTEISDHGLTLEQHVAKVESSISDLDVDLPLSVEAAACMEIDYSKTTTQGEKVADADNNGRLFQNCDSATQMRKVELVGDDKNNEVVVQNSDSTTEMHVKVLNADFGRDTDDDGLVQNSGFSVTEMPISTSNAELVRDRDNNGTVQKVESFTEMPMKIVDEELLEDRLNAVEVPVSGSITELPLEMVDADLLVDTNAEGEVPNSDSAIEPMELMNADLVGGTNNDAVPQVVGSSNGCEEADKDDIEMGNGRIALSGELEALERRRRRRTEIFIGGLNTDAKEEDVRKVFEDVGEIVELRLVINSKTGKNKGFAFVRYASATDAKKALEKYAKVEICGKQCSTAFVEGNDTIFLGNIDKKWTNEDVIRQLQKIGIEKIDEVTVMANPSNLGCNRGFAFVEFETHKDAQIAFKKLQKKDLGKLQNVKIAWAAPLSEPDEEELLKVKSVYAEYLPPSWDEEKLRSYFTKFGAIENIVLSRNLHSCRRKDFAFINFKTREAALACIESLNHEILTDEGSQVNVKVSLAKPVPKGKPHKKVSKPPRKETSKQKHAAQHSVKPATTKTKKTNNQRTDDLRLPGTSELEQVLAERALQKQMKARLGIVNVNYSQSLSGQKRSFSALGDGLSYSDPRGQTRVCLESSFPVGSLSRGDIPSGTGMVPHSYYQRLGADYGLGHRYMEYTNSFQREEAPYRGTGRGYFRYG